MVVCQNVFWINAKGLVEETDGILIFSKTGKSDSFSRPEIPEIRADLQGLFKRLNCCIEQETWL